MAAQRQQELPFSARYSLPTQLASSLGDVSWESVAQLSSEFQINVEQKSSKVKKIVKELQMSRLLLMDRIRHASRGEPIDPKLLVDITHLLQRCEEVAKEYDLDLQEFSTFLYLVSEKLKKEKLAKIAGSRELAHLRPIKEEFSRLKDRQEPAKRRRKK